MAAHIAERAGSERRPTAEVERMENRLTAPIFRTHFRDRRRLRPTVGERDFRRRAEPSVPIETVRNRARKVRIRRRALRPNRAKAPAVNFPNLPDRPRFQQLDDATAGFAGRRTRRDLRRDARFFRRVDDDAPLFERSRQRFDAAKMLPGSERGERNDRVRVIRRPAVDRVDFVPLGVERFAEILVFSRLREDFKRFFGVRPVDIAKRFDLEADPRRVLRLRTADSADADPEKRRFVARRRFAASENGARNDRRRERDRPKRRGGA